MKSPLITALLIATTLAAAPMAQAGDRDHIRHDNDRHGPAQQAQRISNSHDKGYGRAHDHGRYTHQDAHRPYSRHEGRHHAGNHRWGKGERVPVQYRSHQYVVKDWRGHHLQRPVSGHQWVHVDNNYLLISVATGLVVQALLQH